jgi:exopolysaccharide biosynthesis polyprenyl glycosylphosphotransferase
VTVDERGTTVLKAVEGHEGLPLTLAEPALQRPGFVTGLSPDELPGPAAWPPRYVAVLLLLDTLAAAVIGAFVLRLSDQGAVTNDLPLVVCACLVVLWPVLLGFTGTYSQRLIGTGSDEFRKVGQAAVTLLAAAGFTSYAAQVDLSRSVVVFGVPGLALLSLLVRVAARRCLRVLRSRGRCLKRVVVVGRGGAVIGLVEHLGRERFAGLEVVATCVTEADRTRVGQLTGLPVGGLDDVVTVARRLGADAVAVTSASETAAEYLRSLSWQLEGSRMELLVAPGLVEVAGPRLHIRPFEGLPLLSVEQPRFQGWRRVVKSLVDRSLALGALLVLAPAILAVALAVGLSSPGPVLFRQERIGVNGRRFTMYKFRSMVVDADERLAALQAANESDGLLFKMRADPRVTPIGRWLRRFSLDELPQLLNVLGGSMALVGPRPPLPAEAARYDSSVSRRLLVKPGLTGLWQISGRSDLPWEEAVRLDLRYVENWTLALDAKIIWKTLSAVLRSHGAY